MFQGRRETMCISYLGPVDIVREIEKAGFSIIAGPHYWNVKLMINHTKDPFIFKEFGQALTYAIPRNKIVNIVLRGQEIPGNPGLISPDSPWYNPEVNQFSHNPEKTKKLLEKLGYKLKDSHYHKDGKPLEIELKRGLLQGA